MRSLFISCLWVTVVLISGCSRRDQVDKNRLFTKHTGVEVAALKGKVKSIVTYKYSQGDSFKLNSVFRLRFDGRGLIVESTDTVGASFTSDKFYYGNDGLLAKRVSSGRTPFPTSVDTYLYSISEGKKTCITSSRDSSGTERFDTSVYLYDKNGNEIEYKRRETRWSKKYDKHGFLIMWTTTMYNGTTYDIRYENDNYGRVLKRTWSNSRRMDTHVYNKDGNEIQETDFDSDGRKKGDWFIGYCEFDEKGNYLKSIGFSPQTKDMTVTRRLIEYY